MMRGIKRLILTASLIASLSAPAYGFFVDQAPGARENPFIVVIDPGHGGHDSGAIGPGGVEEKNVTLAIARTLARKIRARCVCKVLLTRNDDSFVPLRDRTAFANRNKADIFISIHTNAARKRDVDGFETFFASFDATDEEARQVAELENSSDSGGETSAEADDLRDILKDLKNTAANHESSILAETIQTSLLKTAKGEDRGVKQAPFAVLISADMPSVLVEVGFITNPKGERRLESKKGRERIADAIVDGISGFRKTFAKEKDFIGFLNAGEKAQLDVPQQREDSPRHP